MEETAGSVCVPWCVNLATQTCSCGQVQYMVRMCVERGGDGVCVCVCEKVGDVRIIWEEREKDCVGREWAGSEGECEREDWRWEGKEERCTNKC